MFDAKERYIEAELKRLEEEPTQEQFDKIVSEATALVDNLFVKMIKKID